MLVVEDEESILELLRYNLDKAGFAVIPAGSGEDGLALARRRRPDLVLLDLMLPGMDGLEVCRMLKKSKETENIPIVMLTARGEEADIVAGLERGTDYPVTERAVDVQIVGLRRKLGAAGALIETVRGVGYRFRD